jgi:hypothetical protein
MLLFKVWKCKCNISCNLGIKSVFSLRKHLMDSMLKIYPKLLPPSSRVYRNIISIIEALVF